MFNKSRRVSFKATSIVKTRKVNKMNLHRLCTRPLRSRKNRYFHPDSTPTARRVEKALKYCLKKAAGTLQNRILAVNETWTQNRRAQHNWAIQWSLRNKSSKLFRCEIYKFPNKIKTGKNRAKKNSTSSAATKTTTPWQTRTKEALWTRSKTCDSRTRRGRPKSPSREAEGGTP